ncbi:ABC transporter permease [Corynebacterium testudinoris]|uniref:ABC-type multidrug transport system, permease component n=1 Tax=Corynebacterium testudinoris TaxID=136857 RepID=A0A0G3HCC7_9CORY|nr:ABC transporter permease [Corynebacterium testudinoris]AKK09603.1 ABC-type multidrug transport system, permease component [Corynebacterium testudinoris]
MKALIVKEFRELARDRRTLAMLIALPVLLLVIFGYAANFSVERVQVIVVGPDAETVSSAIASNPAIKDEVDITRVDPTLGDADAQSLLKGQEANAVVVAKQFDGAQAPLTDRMHVYVDGSSLFSAQATQRIAMQLGVTQPPTVLFNPDLKTSWVMVPGLIGLILLFIGALITSIGLVRERETGTLEQLAVMPLRPSAIILGKIIPYFLLALVDMAAVTALGVWLFGVPFVGSLWLFSISALIFLLVVLGIGVLISSVSQSTGQSIQMAILFVVPQVLLSGLIFPLDAMPLGVRWIGYILPLTWFREIAQGVMLRGADLTSLWLPLTVLTVMAIVAFGAATARMRHTLTHGGAR